MKEAKEHNLKQGYKCNENQKIYHTQEYISVI